jgi:hypothetical protein
MLNVQFSSNISASQQLYASINAFAGDKVAFCRRHHWHFIQKKKIILAIYLCELPSSRCIPRHKNWARYLAWALEECLIGDGGAAALVSLRIPMKSSVTSVTAYIP